MAEHTHADRLNSFFTGEGEMAELMRSHDWSQTPLGPVEQWPQSLRTTISILLSTRHPMFLFWGAELVQFYNDGFRPSLGAHKHPKALGQRGEECWSEIWHIIGSQIDSVMTKGEETWHEDQLVPFDRNGYFEEIYFTYSYSPVRDETGEVGGTLVVCTETTQQVLSHRRLQTLRELGAGLKAKTVEAAYQAAMDALSANPHDLPFALLYRVDPDSERAELVGTTGVEPGTDISPEYLNLTQSQWDLAQVYHTQQAKVVEDLAARFQTLPAGIWDTPPSSAIVLPITQSGQDNSLAGVLILGLSPRRALDDSYRGFIELVASNIASAITNADAYQAERQRAEALAELDQAKTTFFSNISHEFRTPLTLMLAPIEDALTDPEVLLSHKQRDRLEIVRRNGQRLLKLVNTLLDFSRIEAGRIEAVYEPTDLATFTADLASTFRSLVEQSGLSFQVDCPPLPEAIYVDREMWQKIVLNLLSNAFKFTLTGTISTHLQYCRDHVELAIIDTGIGIPAEEIPHLFQRFHRVKGAQGRSVEGSGIGLSLVQELVKLHRGHIQVSSQLGQGSRIIVSIPTGLAHLPAEHIRSFSASTAIGTTSYVEEAWRWLSGATETLDLDELSLDSSPVSNTQSSAAHILVVDDNADMRAYVKRLLEHRYTVEAVPDGEAALAAIAQRLPNLVLTDVMMPRIDGFELLQALRAQPKTRELPIILLSARAGEEARVEGLEAGADDYLTKPFSSRELMARVEANLKMTQLRQEAALREHQLRTAAEQAQQEAEATFARLTQLLESMSDAFVELDQDWRITYQNAAAERISCHTLHNTLRDTLHNTLHDTLHSQGFGKTDWKEWFCTTGSELKCQYYKAMTEQVPVHFEYHYHRSPDLDVWLEIHAYPFEERLGVFFRDITDRKQAEAALRQTTEELEIRVAERTEELQQANFRLHRELSQRRRIEQQLRQSEARYRAIVEDQTELIARFWADRTIQFVNDAYCRYFNVAPEAILGKSYNPLIYADDRDAVAQQLQSMGVDQPMLVIENRVINGQGEVRWTQWCNRILFDSQGNLIEFQSVGRDITELKQAEQALRNSEERLQLALEASRDGIWDWNLALNEIYYSPQYFQMLGYSATEWPQALSTWEQLVHPDDMVWLRKILQAHLQDSSVRYEFDYRLRTKSGDWKWIANYGKVVAQDASGSPLRMIGTHRDINDRKLIEAALRQSEERRRLALDLTHIGFWDLHLVSGDLAWNNNHFTLLGLPANSTTPRHQDWRDRVHPDDIERVEQQFLNSIDTHTNYESEYRVIYPDGSVHWLMARGRAIYSEQNQPLRSLGVILDISNLKHMEASLQESDRRWRFLLDNVQLVVIGLDINGNVEYINPFFLALSGYQLEEVIGQYWFDCFLSPSQRPTVKVAFREVLEQNFHLHYQNTIVTKSGEERMIAWSNTVLRDTLGQIIGTISIGEDITERYKVERMKAEFVSVVSHELRTPLTSMQAALSLLDEKIIDPNSEEGEATIQIAAAGTDRLVRLVNDILDLERLESGKVRLEKYLCNIDDLVDTAIAQMQEMANQVEITFTASLCRFQIEADGDRLLQVLTNLLSNAIKFSPNCSVIQLSVERQEAQEPQALLFMVRDRGRGIPADSLESIFDRFHQVDASDSRNKGGTGLGLAICRSIVQQHGGEIWAESAIGQGSTFYFTIPIIRAEE